MRFLIPTLAALAALPALAHEDGAPFSGAIIDPLVLHHAHVENEQRINLVSLRGAEGFGGRKRSAFQSELELAWSSKDFRFGAEVFIPFSRIPSPAADQTQAGVGDVEVRPIKYSFVNRADLVMSTATGITLPTGNKEKGLGRGNTALTQYLFLDKAVGNWYLGFNLSADVRIKGDNGSGTGYGTVLAYSFIEGTPADSVAKPRPSQSIVIAPSIEFIGERRWSGPDAREKTASILPGFTLWWPKSGWQLRLGVSFPATQTREADRAFLLEFGNHLNWERLFSGKGHD